MLDFMEEEERKVEYIELIYDLIFVYAISRCGAVLHLEHGIPGWKVYVTFCLYSLAVLELWNSSTLFINRFPAHRIQRDACIFINMFLMYYLAGCIRTNWHVGFYQFHIVWTLILLHHAAQYWFALRHAEEREKYLKSEITLHLTQAAIVLLSIPLYALTEKAYSPLALLTGVGYIATAEKNEGRAVDFPHLTERIMLYVVFSFGEMIVDMSGFFDSFAPLDMAYAFLSIAFAAGLFLTYGYFYDNIIDREQPNTGDGYLLLHMVLILAISYLTQMMTMLRNDLIPSATKSFSLAMALFVYVLFLSLLERYAKERAGRRYYIRLAQISLTFAFMLQLTHEHAAVSFFFCVVYVYAIYSSIRLYHRRKIAGVSGAVAGEAAGISGAADKEAVSVSGAVAGEAAGISNAADNEAAGISGAVAGEAAGISNAADKEAVGVSGAAEERDE